MMTSEPTGRRWDDLPESIIQHIQSLLPTPIDGFNSSIVSKTCLRAWSNRPFLRFHHPKPALYVPPLSGERYSPWPQIERSQIQADFIKSIDDTLARYQKHDLPLQKFHLVLTLKDHPEALMVRKWVQVVCRLAGLKEISLHIKQTDDRKYRIHIGQIFFSPKNLETVILTGCSLEVPFHPHEIKCSHLRHLELHGVGAGQALLDSLFTACPLIETIILRRCETLGAVIKVKNLRHLRSFTFKTSQPHVVEVENTQNLCSFHYESVTEHSIRTLKINADPALTCLNISGHNMHLFQGYLRIGYFTLSGDAIHVTSDSLKELNLSLMSDYLHPADVHIYAPNLIGFKYNGDSSSSAMPPLTFAKEGPCEMRLSTSDPNRLDTSYFHRMREILRRSSSGSRVELYMYTHTEVNIDVHKLMMVSHPPRIELKVLRLGIGPQISAAEAKIVDAFFLICQPRMVRVCYCVPFKEFFIKVLMESESPRCCAAHGQNRCWRHYLKGYVIGFRADESLVDDDDDGNITWLPGHEWTFALAGYDLFFELEWLY